MEDNEQHKHDHEHPHHAHKEKSKKSASGAKGGGDDGAGAGKDKDVWAWVQRLVSKYCLGRSEYVKKDKVCKDVYDIVYDNIIEMKADYAEMKDMDEFMKYIGDDEESGTQQLSEITDGVVSVLMVVQEKFLEKDIVGIDEKYVNAIEKKLEMLIKNFVQSKPLDSD